MILLSKEVQPWPDLESEYDISRMVLWVSILFGLWYFKELLTDDTLSEVLIDENYRSLKVFLKQFAKAAAVAGLFSKLIAQILISRMKEGEKYILREQKRLEEEKREQQKEEKDQEEQRKMEDERYEFFLNFINHRVRNQYDIMLLDDLNPELDLKYNISPVKDKNGDPEFYEDEFRKMYLVKVNKAAFISSKSDIDKYKFGPLRTNEVYFCQFRDGYWHLCDETMPRKAHKFIMAGMGGVVRTSESANKYSGQVFSATHDHKEILNIVIDKNGKKARSGDHVIVFEDSQKGGVFVKINDSLCKEVYLRNSNEDISKINDYFLELEYPDGYLSQTSYNNLLSLIESAIEEQSVVPRKVNYWDLKRFKFR